MLDTIQAGTIGTIAGSGEPGCGGDAGPSHRGHVESNRKRWLSTLPAISISPIRRITWCARSIRKPGSSRR